MKLHIEISAPELITAIISLAESLEKLEKTAALHVDALDRQEKTFRAFVENGSNVQNIEPDSMPEAIAEETVLDIVAVRATINEAINAGKITNVDVRKLLADFNAPKLTDLLPEKYKEFLGQLIG